MTGFIISVHIHAQGIVEPSGSAVRELQLILNWMQVCFLENAHLKTENFENIPQKYTHTYIYDTLMTTFVNVIEVLNIGHGAVLCIDRVQYWTYILNHNIS
jgi:hypothetical protein